MVYYTGRYKDIEYEVDMLFEPHFVKQKIEDYLESLNIYDRKNLEKVRLALDILGKYLNIAYSEHRPISEIAKGIVMELYEKGVLENVKERAISLENVIKGVEEVLRRYWDWCYCITKKEEIINKINKVLEIFEKTDPERFDLLRTKHKYNVRLIFYCNENTSGIGGITDINAFDGEFYITVKIYGVETRSIEDLLYTLSHETKHIEQTVKRTPPPKYEKLAPWESPYEIEAYEYASKIVELARDLGLLGLAILITIILVNAKRKEITL